MNERILQLLPLALKGDPLAWPSQLPGFEPSSQDAMSRWQGRPAWPFPGSKAVGVAVIKIFSMNYRCHKKIFLSFSLIGNVFNYLL